MTENYDFRSRVLTALDEIKTEIRGLNTKIDVYRDDHHILDKRVVKLEERDKLKSAISGTSIAGGGAGLLALLDRFFHFFGGSSQ